MPATNKELRKLLDVAAGRREADLYVEGGSLVNVLSGEIYPANVAICQDKIVYVGESRKMVTSNTTVIDARGQYLCPGFIEPHYHPWMILSPVALAQTALCRGITTIVCDNLFYFVKFGAEGFLKIVRFCNKLPVRFLWAARVMHQSPDPDEEEIFSVTNLKKVFNQPEIIKVAEITRWPLIEKGDSSLIKKICLAGEHHLGLEGHTAGCSYDRLNVIAASGLESCHEAITPEEVIQRLRLGFWTMLRYSSLRPDLPELLRVITEMNIHTGRMLFTTDGSVPSFISKEGLLDGMLRIAVKAGINPVTALQLVTINPASYLGMDNELGSIAPGRRADILILPDLEKFIPHMVLSGGKVTAVNGRPVAPLPPTNWEEMGFHTSLPNPDLLNNPTLYGVPSDGPEIFPVIVAVSAAITKRQDRLLHPQGGLLNREEDLLYCTLIDRNSKWLSNGFIQGLGQIEAFATTYNTSFNLLVIGKDRLAMARAASEVSRMNGGMVLIEGGRVAFRLPLELGGAMSNSSFSTLAGIIQELEDKVKNLGYPHNDFLYTLLFIVCDFLPGLRITAFGIKDVKTQQILVPTRNLI